MNLSSFKWFKSLAASVAVASVAIAGCAADTENHAAEDEPRDVPLTCRNVLCAPGTVCQETGEPYPNRFRCVPEDGRNTPSPPPAPDGYESYVKAGFTVFVNKAVLAHPDESRAILDNVEASLAEVRTLFGEARATRLASVRIWIEWEYADLRERPNVAEFHVSRDWLASMGYNVAKEHAVDIRDTRGFLRLTRTHQPFMLLHELTHAYDFTVLDASDLPSIDDAL